MPKYYYKVVRNLNTKKYIISYPTKEHNQDYLVSRFSDGKTIRYYKSRATKRPKNCGALCVFDSISCAKEWCSEEFNEIWKCTIVPSKDKCVYVDGGKYQSSRYTFPEGTVLADEVRLIERVV